MAESGDTVIVPISANDPVRIRAGASGIAARLREAIAAGRYQPSERLPPERELAGHFNAARNTVRQALNLLESEGLVVRRAGSGTYVQAPVVTTGLPSLREIAEITSPVELIDVRLAIEPVIVQTASANATSRDIDEIERHLIELEEADGDYDRFSIADETFHMAIAQATRNPLFVWIYAGVNDVRSHENWDKMKKSVLSVTEIETYNNEHRELWDAIAHRDAQRAKQLMIAHLNHARHRVLGWTTTEDNP
ncbi:MAG: FadR/GntR family transcriptional regulator [Alphaproteobacteria bacterium]